MKHSDYRKVCPGRRTSTAIARIQIEQALRSMEEYRSRSTCNQSETKVEYVLVADYGNVQVLSKRINGVEVKQITKRVTR